MAVLATIGMIDTGSITAKRWGWIGSLSCPGGSDGCDKVLGSAWGTLLGQPLSLFGFLAYGAVLNQCNEEGYRRLAEQGLAQCQGGPTAPPRATEPEAFNLPATPWLAQLRDPQQALAEIQQAWASVPAATPVTQPEPRPLDSIGIAASPWDSAAQEEEPVQPPSAPLGDPDSAEPDLPDTDLSEPARATSSEQNKPEPAFEPVADELDKGLLLVKLSSPGGQRD